MRAIYLAAMAWCVSSSITTLIYVYHLQKTVFELYREILSVKCKESAVLSKEPAADHAGDRDADSNPKV